MKLVLDASCKVHCSWRKENPSVCLSFGGRSVLNDLRLDLAWAALGGKKSLRADRPSSDQHPWVINVKTSGRTMVHLSSVQPKSEGAALQIMFFSG